VTGPVFWRGVSVDIGGRRDWSGGDRWFERKENLSDSKPFLEQGDLRWNGPEPSMPSMTMREPF